MVFDHLDTDHPAVLPSFHVRDAFGLLAGQVHDLPQGGLYRLPGGVDGAALRRAAPSPVPAAAGHGPVRPGGLGLVLLGLIAVPHRFVVVTSSRFDLIPRWLVLVLVLLGRFEVIPGRF